MFSLDMRTAIFSYILISVISTIVVMLLLQQYKDRYKGVYHMLICFALQTVALILILVRGYIPDWISFDLSNTISVAGIMLFYVGLEEYTGKKSSKIPNIILLILFATVHSWFTFIKPDLAIRHLNVSIVWFIMFGQSIWLILYRDKQSTIRLSSTLSIVCLGFCIVCLVRIFKFFFAGHTTEDYFNSDVFDTAVIIVSQVLLILLIFSLAHMFSSRLMKDIKTEEEKFSKAFHTSPYGISLSRLSDSKIIEINNGVYKITGYAPEEVRGKKTLDLNFWLSADDRIQFIEELQRCGKIHERELKLKRKTGELIEVLYSAEVIKINNEACVLSSFEDITQRKMHELDLVSAKEKAEESDRLKTAFMHNISHEIRTPMNAIVGFSALLGEPELSDESRQHFIDIVTQSSDHLLSIVNDIMEISNIEAGIQKLKVSDFNLNKLLGDLHRQFLPKSVKKVIDFRVSEGLPDSDADIMSDKTKIFQIISNLLNNAFKFTDSGQIEMGYRLINDKLEFHVSDTGIGIPPDRHEKIFDRFYQIEYSSTRPYEGTGLGLSILKSYIELLGGEIWVESESGKGTRFYFTIPFIKAGEQQTQYPEKESKRINLKLDNKTILVAEDTESNFQLLAEFLNSTNVNLIHARNGQEAVEYCQSEKKIDLVLMDIKMPIMNGFEATGVIRNINPDLPVIAQTAFAFESEKNKILPRGFIDYISKPYNKRELLDLVGKYLS